MRVVASRGDCRRSSATAWSAVELSEASDGAVASAPSSGDAVRVAVPIAARTGERAGARAGERDRSWGLGDAEAGAAAGACRAASACKRSFRRRASEDVRAGGCSQKHPPNRSAHPANESERDGSGSHLRDRSLL